MTFHRSLGLVFAITTGLVFGCQQPQKNSNALEQRIHALVAKIDEHPAITLHADYTPAVEELVSIGEPAFPMILPLIEHTNEMTRLRGQHVLEIVTMEMYGFSWGQGWDRDGSEEKWRAFWRSLGDLRYDSSLADRQKAMRLWYEWIQKRKSHVV